MLYAVYTQFLPDTEHKHDGGELVGFLTMLSITIFRIDSWYIAEFELVLIINKHTHYKIYEINHCSIFAKRIVIQIQYEKTHKHLRKFNLLSMSDYDIIEFAVYCRT